MRIVCHLHRSSSKNELKSLICIFYIVKVTKDWVACGICEDFLPSWKVLKRHRENAHANNIGQIDDNDESFNENLDSELDR